MLTKFKSLYTDPLYRNSIAIMLNSAIGALFGLLFWIVAARTIPAKEIGLAITAISTATLIVTLSELGLGAGIVRYLPESKNKNVLYSTIAIVALLLSLILAFLFLGGVGTIAPAISFLREGWFLPAFLGYVAIMSIYSIQNITLIAIRRADMSFAQNLLLGTRIPILFLIAHLGVLGILSAFGFAFIIAFILGAYILNKYDLSLKINLDTSSIRNKIRFSLGNYTANIFMIAPTTIIPVMILNTFGAEESAYFYVAYSFAGLLTMVPNAVAMSLFVEGSHSMPLKENVLKSIKLIILFLAPGLVIIFFLGDKLLLLFGIEYSKQSFDIMRLLAVSSIFSAGNSIYLSIKKIHGDVMAMNYVSFSLSILILGLGYVGIKEYGLVGLGYAWLVGNAIVCTAVVRTMVWSKN